MKKRNADGREIEVGVDLIADSGGVHVKLDGSSQQVPRRLAAHPAIAVDRPTVVVLTRPNQDKTNSCHNAVKKDNSDHYNHN